MRIWSDHNKDSAYAPASRILGGLTSEQAGTLAPGLPHSIYQELWHATIWQRLVLDMDEEARKNWEEQMFPSSPIPESEAQWQGLVSTFFTDIQKGEQIATETSTLDQQYFEGYTARELLEDLAVHNAYHLARIVAVRQVLGLWNPA
jgi:hypothetical protein